MCQLLINFTYDTISLKMSNYNFVQIYVWNILVYMFWKDFSFFFSRNFLVDLCFYTPLACSPHYSALIVFSITKTIIRLVSNKMCSYCLRLNDTFIPANMDVNFPETQTPLDEKLQKTFPSIGNVDIKILICLYPKYSN